MTDVALWVGLGCAEWSGRFLSCIFPLKKIPCVFVVESDVYRI